MREGLEFQWHKACLSIVVLFFAVLKAVLHFLYLNNGSQNRVKVPEKITSFQKRLMGSFGSENYKSAYLICLFAIMASQQVSC